MVDDGGRYRDLAGHERNSCGQVRGGQVRDGESRPAPAPLAQPGRAGPGQRPGPGETRPGPTGAGRRSGPPRAHGARADQHGPRGAGRIRPSATGLRAPAPTRWSRPGPGCPPGTSRRSPRRPRSPGAAGGRCGKRSAWGGTVSGCVPFSDGVSGPARWLRTLERRENIRCRGRVTSGRRPDAQRRRRPSSGTVDRSTA